MFSVLTREKTSVHYCIDIDAEDLLKILNLDTENCATDGRTLYDHLMNIDAVEEVEYDRMFGPHLFFKVDADRDNSHLWEFVEQVVNGYLGES